MRSGTPAIAGGKPVRDDSIGYGGQSIGAREKEAVLDALDSDYITRGPRVEEFEQAIADYVGVDHAIMVTSGTAALQLSARAAGFDHDDEVITTPLTFTATANAIAHTGATPIFADIDSNSRNIDPTNVKSSISESSAGLIPVHYAGQPCDIEALFAIGDKYDLSIIWDACHAIGSRWRGELIGSQRDMAVFSFHPVKTITTGEGGMVVTDDDLLAERVRSMRSFCMDRQPDNHDREPWYQVVEDLGFNYNVTEFQAALGLVQLQRIDEFASKRQKIVNRYDEAFDSMSGIDSPAVKPDVNPVWHLYAVEITSKFGCSRRDFVRAMHCENIGVQVHYVPLHYHPYYQRLYGYEQGDFPVTERVYEGLVSLPLFPAMGEEDVSDVIQAIKRLHEHFS